MFHLGSRRAPDRKKQVKHSVQVTPAQTGASARRSIALVYGVVCHLAFVVGVATMIWAMFHGMSRSHGTVPPPWSLAANAALLLQFPVLHSLLLGPLGRPILAAIAPRSISAPLATTTYVIVASVQVFVLFRYWTPSGIVWWRADGAMLWLLGSLYAASWLLLLKAIWDAGLSLQTGFLGWWAVLRQRAPAFPPMPTGGLFRVVRQPIYVAFALTLWTVPTWTPDQLAVAITLTAYCLIGPLFKEARFRRRFGAGFAAYAREVPYWVPRLGPAAAAQRPVDLWRRRLVGRWSEMDAHLAQHGAGAVRLLRPSGRRLDRAAGARPRLRRRLHGRSPRRPQG